MTAEQNRGTVIDIDIGGTFTDCFVRRSNGDSTAVKTPTTGFRLAVGFRQGLEEAANRFGMTTGELLLETTSSR